MLNANSKVSGSWLIVLEGIGMIQVSLPSSALWLYASQALADLTGHKIDKPHAFELVICRETVREAVFRYLDK